MKSEQVQPAIARYTRLTSIEGERVALINTLETQRENAGLEITKARIVGIQNLLEDSISRLAGESATIQKEITSHITRRMSQVQRLFDNGHITVEDFEKARVEQGKYAQFFQDKSTQDKEQNEIITPTVEIMPSDPEAAPLSYGTSLIPRPIVDVNTSTTIDLDPSQFKKQPIMPDGTIVIFQPPKQEPANPQATELAPNEYLLVSHDKKGDLVFDKEQALKIMTDPAITESQKRELFRVNVGAISSRFIANELSEQQLHLFMKALNRLDDSIFKERINEALLAFDDFDILARSLAVEMMIQLDYPDSETCSAKRLAAYLRATAHDKSEEDKFGHILEMVEDRSCSESDEVDLYDVAMALKAKKDHRYVPSYITRALLTHIEDGSETAHELFSILERHDLIDPDHIKIRTKFDY